MALAFDTKILQEYSTTEEVAPEQFFPVPVSNLRAGDHVRFRGVRGNLVEGIVTGRSGGTWWCGLEPVKPPRATRPAYPPRPQPDHTWLQRRGVPEMPARVLELLDWAETADVQAIVALALNNAVQAGEVADMLLHVDAPWWGVWERAHQKLKSRAWELGPFAARSWVPAADTFAAACVAMTLDEVLGEKTRQALLRGYVAALVDRKTAAS